MLLWAGDDEAPAQPGTTDNFTVAMEVGMTFTKMAALAIAVMSLSLYFLPTSQVKSLEMAERADATIALEYAEKSVLSAVTAPLLGGKSTRDGQLMQLVEYYYAVRAQNAYRRLDTEDQRALRSVIAWLDEELERPNLPLVAHLSEQEAFREVQILFERLEGRYMVAKGAVSLRGTASFYFALKIIYPTQNVGQSVPTHQFAYKLDSTTLTVFEFLPELGHNP